jgi:hypothetical protein
MISEMEAGDVQEIKLVNADVMEEYHQWLPKDGEGRSIS